MLIGYPANLPTTTCGMNTKCKTAALPLELTRSTLWRRARGRPSRLEKAAEQQYLTPSGKIPSSITYELSGILIPERLYSEERL